MIVSSGEKSGFEIRSTYRSVIERTKNVISFGICHKQEYINKIRTNHAPRGKTIISLTSLGILVAIEEAYSLSPIA